MHNDHMKEGRLTTILFELLNHRSVSARVLAEKLEVSVRTVYRYIDELYAIGIPLIIERGRNGGIRMDEKYVLRSALFTDEEKQQLLSALRVGKNITGNIPQTLIDKVCALFQGKNDNVIEVNLKRWGDENNDNTLFYTLHDACLSHHQIRITYITSDGTKTIRIVYPISLLYHTSAWYVKAYCTLRNDFRMFRLTRILSIEVLTESFTPMRYPETEPYSPKETEVELLFDQSAAYRVYDDFDVSQISKLDDGCLSVRTFMPYDGWLIGYVLSFGSKVQIVRPERLKQDITKEIEKMRNT